MLRYAERTIAAVSEKLSRAGEEVSDAELLKRARELRPLVEQQAAETERLTRISEDTHRRFEEAGFYRMLMPKRYGGLEMGLPTYVKLWMEFARGDASAAWCGCLAGNHSLQLGSPEPAEKGAPSGPPLLFVAPRSAFKILDDWGNWSASPAAVPTASCSTKR
jgi:alkylation response protein AidB-like acyl-CoA dehydrogenase